MLELLLADAGAAGRKLYPWSGPGSKSILRGSETLGYFGEVTSKELLSLSELRDQLNFQTGIPYSTWNGNWIKMFIDGKVIFFPTSRIASGITWENLYNAGLVYGEDSNGTYPTSTPTNQLRYVGAANTAFKVRLFSSCTIDPSGMGGTENLGNTPNTTLLNGEWYRIIAPLVTPKLNTYNGPWWGLYVQTSQILPNDQSPFAWAKETRSTAFSTSGHTINNTQVMPSNTKTTALAWLPVLEVDPNSSYVFPITYVTALGTDMPSPVATGQAESTIEKPTDLIGGFNGVAPVSNVTVEYPT